ncbi:MAG: 1-phosphofructokinase family hexose kinase [Armatimonadetes bacterium]|nr:1-phosphofructokinase family hexose kinase [Armatimonadota bacterium]
MLLTVTPNAAVDKTFQVERFEMNKVHRPLGFRAVAGGKGINVARVAHALGEPVMATGFLGGHTGEFIADSLKEIGIPARFVSTREESRTCIAVIDLEVHSQTEVNENGPNVTPEEVAALVQRFEELLEEGVTQVALCGSLPPQCPSTFYADLIRIAQDRGISCALDSSGEALANGFKARPDLLKCNRNEFRAIVPDVGVDLPDLVRACAALLGDGTRTVAVTLGAEGAVAVDAEGAWFAAPPPIRFVSAVGSGDAFLAAFLHARRSGESLPRCLEWGTAAGAANAGVVGAGYCTRAEIERLAPRTQSQRIQLPLSGV